MSTASSQCSGARKGVTTKDADHSGLSDNRLKQKRYSNYPRVCYDFQDGKCGRKYCKYPHVLVEAGSSRRAGLDKSDSKADDTRETKEKSALATITSPDIKTTSSTTTGLDLPPKLGCVFCSLGLCTTEHRTASSFSVQDGSASSVSSDIHIFHLGDVQYSNTL